MGELNKQGVVTMQELVGFQPGTERRPGKAPHRERVNHRD
jgi:hypothetical protein